jgi:hypothetical protein
VNKGLAMKPKCLNKTVCFLSLSKSLAWKPKGLNESISLKQQYLRKKILLLIQVWTKA